jgi:predicted GTPase
MMSKQMIEKLSKIEEIAAKNDDLLRDDAHYVRRINGIGSPEELERQLDAIAEENRLLTIGIIGRVNSGKSSLLNSVFFNGESVLPEAATPMTAALTVLTYGEQNTAKAEFFSPEDMTIIRRDHREFQELYNRVLEEKKKGIEERAKTNRENLDDQTLLEKARSAAMRDDRISRNVKKASHEQYEQMKASGQNIDALCAQKDQIIHAAEFLKITDKLQDYVGAHGNYMPFTKSVELHLNLDDLRDIRVVDTPGLNDPLKSREARTEEYLRECDVVFIVSPAGGFITEQDMELMDRLSSREGVRELFLVASMADLGIRLQSVFENSGGVLKKAIDALKEELTEHAIDSLSGLKKRHPEVTDQFDQLINEGKERIIITSGICNSMSLRFEDRVSWNETMKGILEKLIEYYPDNFDESSCKASLDLLGNTLPVHEKIKMVRESKDKIIADKSADYSRQQGANIEKYRAGLLDLVTERIKQLSMTDLQALDRRKKQLEEFIETGSDTIETKLREFFDGARSRLNERLSEYSRRLSSSVEQATAAEETEESHDEKRQEKKKGIGGGIARIFGWILGTSWGWETIVETVTIHTLRAGAVKRKIEEKLTQFSNDVEKVVTDEISAIKNDLPGKIKNAFREESGNGVLDPAHLNRSVNTMIRAYTDDIGWDFTAPSFDYPASGTISDYEVENFKNALANCLRELNRSYKNNIQELFHRIEENKAGREPSGFIFSDLRAQIEALGKDLENKTSIIERLGKIKASLQEVN